MAPSAVDPEKVKAEARAEALKSLGFDSEDAYKAHLDEKKKAEDAKLSEAERSQRALTEALNNHKAAEAKLSKLKTELEGERAERALERLFYAQGVRPEAQTVARALYDAEKKADPKAEDGAIFDKIRKEWPNVFGAPATQPATTSTQAPSASPFGNGPSQQPGQVDALLMNDQQILEFRNRGNRA